MKQDKTLALAYAAFAVVCVVWGTTYLAIRVALETIPPLLMTATRFTIAGLVMLGIARMRGEQIPRDRRTLLNLFLVGVALIGVGNFAVVWAEQWVPSGTAALFVASGPFWMALLETLRSGGERTNLRSGLGMLIGFVGVALLVTPKGAGGSYSSGFLLGALAIQLGSFGWQWGSLRGKYHLKHVGLLTSSAMQMLFGGLFVGVLGFALGEAPRYHVNPRTLAAVIYLTLFGSILAFSCYVFALAHMRTTHSSLYAYINPVVAVVLGWLILNEQLTWISVLAMAVILCGVALVQTSGTKKVTDATPAEAAKEAA